MRNAAQITLKVQKTPFLVSWAKHFIMLVGALAASWSDSALQQPYECLSRCCRTFTVTRREILIESIKSAGRGKMNLSHEKLFSSSLVEFSIWDPVNVWLFNYALVAQPEAQNGPNCSTKVLDPTISLRIKSLENK